MIAFHMVAMETGEEETHITMYKTSHQLKQGKIMHKTGIGTHRQQTCTEIQGQEVWAGVQLAGPLFKAILCQFPVDI